MRAAMRTGDGPEARLRAMLAALAEYLTSHPGTCAGLLDAFGAAGRLDEVLQASDTWIAAPLREVLAHGRDAGVFAAGGPRRCGHRDTGRSAARGAGTCDDRR
jgi:TetR/AcrR family transcriptional regulator